MRTFMRAAVTLVAALAAAITSVSAAGGATSTYLGKSTGGVGFVDQYGNAQYFSYSAFDYGTTGDKGTAEYTNFSVAQPGTHIWVPSTFNLGFGLGIDPTIVATYNMTTDPTSLVALAPNAVRFAGTGSTPGWNATFTGTLSGTALTMAITEINASDSTETYAMTLNGTVDPVTGAATGTWSDNYGTGRTGTFAVTDIGYEAFHNVNAVTSAAVGTPFTFTYMISSGPAVGLTIPVAVTDESTPAVAPAPHDTLVLNGRPETLLNGNLNVFPR